MRQLIKKILPRPLKNFLIAIKSKTIDSYQKKKLAKRMQIKHQELLAGLKGKEKIRVVFLAIHKSVWKVDTVFQRMLEDPFFEPEILVCPYMPYGEERMLEDMEQTYSYFKNKGYSVTKSLKNDGSWIKLEELDPDIVFFTNPHNLTLKEYYENAYFNYLSCYVPYHHEVGSYGGPNGQHNQYFHNAMWVIFSAHEKSYELAKKVSENKGCNIKVTGFPAMEELYVLMKSERKKTDSKFKLIWAPHHLINEDVNQSNFLEYSDFFKELAIKYKDKLELVFKPHPVLLSKLYEHKSWGKERADEYYLFWRDSGFSNIELGCYEKLFHSSDAMIHDCGSFLIEYLYMKKPVMYLLNERHKGQFFNVFGQEALSACRIAFSKEDIEDFVVDLIENNIDITTKHKELYDLHIKKYFEGKFPSERIVTSLKMEIKL